MSTPAVGGILSAGVLVARQLAASGIYLDDGQAPVLNVAHQWPAGAINLSAGANPAQQFTVSPVAAGNTQIFTGPNATIANTLTAPGSVYLGAANVGTSLTVTGPTSLTGNAVVTGSFLTTGSTTIGNTLAVGQTVNVPTLNANVVNVRGPAANLYVETSSALSSNSSGVYLSPVWRIKILSNNVLGFQYLYNGNWVNAQIITPPGVFGTTAGLLSILI